LDHPGHPPGQPACHPRPAHRRALPTTNPSAGLNKEKIQANENTQPGSIMKKQRSKAGSDPEQGNLYATKIEE